MSVSVPGLPAKLENESYRCQFEDSQGRFTITVPAMEAIPGSEYTCNITGQDFNFEGVQAGEKINSFQCCTICYNLFLVTHFSFLSSLVDLPFGTTNNALTIHRCGVARTYVIIFNPELWQYCVCLFQLY